MRIVSGKFKGRHIKTPKNLPVRPTTDYGKESLFNILNNWYYFDELSVLDLFAGTGNISFEFASRGTQRIVSIDANKNCVGFIEQMIEELDIADVLSANRMDAMEYVELTTEKFNVIFADPPYDYDGYPKMIETVFSRELLKENGTLIMEHDRRNDFSEHPYFEDSRKYGNVNYSFFSVPKS
ncbi:MAG: 16S rRNA (guanine(966)-N(2))-methyltransferase RsmD [Schleiferiaceae bacterium]|jgi:16S rRNA (guanine(966)-N(2))-methyltransferase RsmD|nr:16S rRNA (guanine(966)-N(2))-methyltransferase RsmD [Schleiferiaceae bacterium]